MGLLDRQNYWSYYLFNISFIDWIWSPINEFITDLSPLGIGQFGLARETVSMVDDNVFYGSVFKN